MMRKNIKKIQMLCISSLLVVTIFAYSQLNASYKTTDINESSVPVAKFGELKLIEKSNDDPTEIFTIQNESELKYSNVRSGEDIEKSFNIEYKGSEVPSYIFFVLYLDEWQYNSEKRVFYLLNNLGDNYLIYMKLNNLEWKFLKTEVITKNTQTRTGYIYYKEVDAYQDISDVIIEKTYVNLISSNDIAYLNSKDSIGMGAYVISKQGNITTEEQAWNKLKLKI